VMGSKLLDYKQLADWTRSRRGQVIVCEGPNANCQTVKEDQVKHSH
jgi:hypothetical protein